MIPTRELFGVPVSAITIDSALDLIDAAIASRRRMQIGVVNAAKLVNMRRNQELMTDVVSSDMVLADGAAVVWASRLLGRRVPERVAGIDLMMGMIERGNTRGYRVYCLGATAEVLARATAQISSSFPGIAIVGQHHGYFTRDEEKAIADDIAQSHADILLVAMTSPRKERFLARWSRTLDVPICHGVGGSFDVLAGIVKRAPITWQRLGLEWLYRVKQEPRRLWKRYLVTNAAFTMMVCSALLREKIAGLRAPVRPTST